MKEREQGDGGEGLRLGLVGDKLRRQGGVREIDSGRACVKGDRGFEERECV